MNGTGLIPRPIAWSGTGGVAGLWGAETGINNLLVEVGGVCREQFCEGVDESERMSKPFLGICLQWWRSG